MPEVKIDSKRLMELERNTRMLEALQQGGVDNWEWYGESLKEFRKEEELDDLLERYTNEILEVCSLEADVEYPAGRECGHNILFNSDAESSVQRLLHKFMKEVLESVE